MGVGDKSGARAQKAQSTWSRLHFLCSPRTGSYNGNTQQEGQNEAIPGAPEPERVLLWGEQNPRSSPQPSRDSVRFAGAGLGHCPGMAMPREGKSSSTTTVALLYCCFRVLEDLPTALGMSRGQGRMFGAEKLDDCRSPWGERLEGDWSLHGIEVSEVLQLLR